MRDNWVDISQRTPRGVPPDASAPSADDSIFIRGEVPLKVAGATQVGLWTSRLQPMLAAAPLFVHIRDSWGQILPVFGRPPFELQGCVPIRSGRRSMSLRRAACGKLCTGMSFCVSRTVWSIRTPGGGGGAAAKYSKSGLNVSIRCANPWTDAPSTHQQHSDTTQKGH